MGRNVRTLYTGQLTAGPQRIDSQVSGVPTGSYSSSASPTAPPPPSARSLSANLPPAQTESPKTESPNLRKEIGAFLPY